MSLITKKIENYLVYLYGGEEGNAGHEASIHLSLPGATAYLHFFPAGAAIPPNSTALHNNGEPSYLVNYRSSQLHNVVDLLRNEDPVFLAYDDDTNLAYVRTNLEFVGEGE